MLLVDAVDLRGGGGGGQGVGHVAPLDAPVKDAAVEADAGLLLVVPRLAA